MKFSNRSAKAKEKFADSLMALGNTIYGAAFVSVLVFPLTAMMTAIFSGSPPVNVLDLIGRLSWGTLGTFAALYLVPVCAGYYSKEVALNLYDEIAQSQSVKEEAPTVRPKTKRAA